MEQLKKTIKHFLLHCKYEKRLNDKTIKAYSIDLIQFQEFILCKNVQRLRDIDRYLILELLQHFHKKYKTKSIKRKLACVKAMFNHYELENEDFINPFRKIRLQLKEQFKLPTVMSFTEVSSIFQKAYQLKDGENNKKSISYKTIVRDIAVMELLFATGVRVSELVNIPESDINLVEGQIKVLGKGNKERVIQLCNEGLINALKEYHLAFHKQIRRTGYFFINRLNKKLSDQSARTIVKKYADISQISKHITPHVYRHTIATMLLEENVDIKYIQKFLGHSSIVTTQIYTHVSATKQREILSEKHPRNRVLTTV
jgi:integrase/recombinase XerD